jgi:uncharacterized protein affecting Mg2+/Co2+ transport
LQQQITQPIGQELITKFRDNNQERQIFDEKSIAELHDQSPQKDTRAWEITDGKPSTVEVPQGGENELFQQIIKKCPHLRIQENGRYQITSFTHTRKWTIPDNIKYAGFRCMVSRKGIYREG